MKKRVAIPVVQGLLSAHFGHCQVFYVADVEDGKIVGEQELVPPPHAPGVIPRWLSGEGVNVVLVGGIGQKAVNLFKQFDVEPVIGVAEKSPRELINDYIAGELVTGVNQCSH